MMRALFSGVSGLKVHQTKMDVIGNNISNVNTIGFKGSSVTFSDVFYQTTQAASGPNATTGNAGQNAMQIGLGAGVSAITTSITTAGASERTDNPFDLMIEGDNFFVVNSGGSNYFTKAGSFNVDANGTLCTASGAAVMGWQVDSNDSTKTVPSTVSKLNIMAKDNLYAEPEATSKAYISGNIDAKDTQLSSTTGRVVNVSFYDKKGNSYTADMKFTASTDGSNVFNVSITDVKDSDGLSIFAVKSTTDKNDDGTAKYVESSIGKVSLGDDISFSPSAVDEKTGAVTMSDSDTPAKITFDPATGAFVTMGTDSSTSTKALTFSVDATPNPFSDISIDFSSVTMYSTSGSCTLEATRGGLDGTGAGKPVGDMSGVNIDKAGKIYGKYTNGDSKLLGQIAVASFANPAGLEAVGNSMYATTQNSGDFDGIGKDATSGGGSISTGMLEMSNVDLSQQFTDMITTQRGFQANSRIITTSDTLLEELINLKR